MKPARNTPKTQSPVTEWGLQSETSRLYLGTLGKTQILVGSQQVAGNDTNENDDTDIFSTVSY